MKVKLYGSLTAGIGSEIIIDIPEGSTLSDLLRQLNLQTLESFKNGEMLARKPDIDFIMRLSLTDQIKQAEENCLGGDVQLFIFDNYDKLPFSDFTEQELDISEKAALLSVE